MSKHLVSFLNAALVFFSSSALASDPAIVPLPLVVEGDPIAGVGLVTSIDNLVVNDSGQWLVECDTDHAVADADVVMLGNGKVVKFREGQALALPAGATLDSFDAVTLNANGHSGWNFFLAGTTGLSDDSGLYYDAKLVLQEGALSGSPAFTPGTPYIGFFETKLNAANQMLVIASVDDPAIASSVDRALVRLDLDSLGGLSSENVLAKEGDVLAGQSQPVADFGTGPHNFALSEFGNVLYFVDTTDASSVDGNVYLDAALIAREGSPSGVPGRNWSSLSSSRMDLSADGAHWVLTGTLDGSTVSDAVIVRDGGKLVQEGDTLPAIGGVFTFTSFGTGAVRVTNEGDVLWVGDWNEPSGTQDVGLFLNEKLLVQEGVTTIGGSVVESLATVQDNFAISGNGRFVVFEATLAGGVSGAFLIDRGPWADLGFAKAGIAGLPRLLGSGTLQAGTFATLSLARARPAAATVLVIGVTPGLFPFFGTTLVPSLNLVVSGLPTDANGEWSLSGPWPAGVPSGFPIFAQVIVPDPVAVFGVAVSNAMVGTAP